ncbi:glycoside hydrolase family 3 protein [Reinekea blandensis]|uniref:Beta-glucosidase-related Glycosidase n=1 Tax=Reinekea blandensis MED297 TaxID=314283 RepID=A4BA26_9GAMM|nr:glycoside hydrolase family 3 protein [Reinekea blandensis]EAR10782.1 Beta-glucosidase-related Glycosidase [Reinekea sp. MED297] [Reinekea blandensis MED297]
MIKPRYWIALSALLLLTLTVVVSHWPSTMSLGLPNSPYQTVSTWPEFERPVDAALEARIDDILQTMTLRQKVGQMTQGEIQHVRPSQAKEYGLGSVLNGGGSWPGKTPFHVLEDWLELADAYWLASTESATGIPLLWGTDAVHGHNNLQGATLFPHNIALGATGDLELVRSIAAVTADQVRASGVDWTFAPTVAIADNPAWGRSYESFSQDADAVFHFAKAVVEGYQQGQNAPGILATAKHFIGDGATRNGVDQGDAWVSEAILRERHAQGFYGALDADVQVIMASFNSWWTKRLHGHEYLLTDVLKKQMGFDGFVISDWNGINDVYQCLPNSCPQAINAGIDMVMVPTAWKAFIDNTVASVEAGDIPMSRIDDAVRRILRVKLRSGLFEQPRPSERIGAGDESAVNSPELNALARQAVRQSTVLLKNNDQVLPLNPAGRYLVTGLAHRIAIQAGGWSLNWQGGAYDNDYFGPSATLLDGLREWTGANNGSLQVGLPGVNEKLDADAAIVVLSERSYAEGEGDLTAWQSSAAEKQTGFDGIAQLSAIQQRYPELPIVTIVIAGRPLWMNPQINVSDAFVMGWLPGTQGAGIADLLFGEHPFTGRLPFNWPADDCEGLPRSTRRAAFAVGYGLTTDQTVIVPELKAQPAREIGTNGLAPDCVWQRVLLSPFQ